MKKDLLSILDLSARDLSGLITEAEKLKHMRRVHTPHEHLKGKCLAMIFEKASTRTRLSFEVGMHDLGGHALFLNVHDMQIGRGEETRDTARVASRYVHGVMIRAYAHKTITDFAQYATIPVINGLSDREHPCQIIADLMTIREHFGRIEGVRVAWIGDGNNVCNSLLLAAGHTGMEVAVASPPGYSPKEWVLAEADSMRARIEVTESPDEAVAGADVIMTDAWISMGDEEEAEKRLRAFQGYQVDDRLVSRATPDVVVMHCLPAHRGQEITDSVLEGPHSLVWDEAENRLHCQKAVLVRLLAKRPV